MSSHQPSNGKTWRQGDGEIWRNGDLEMMRRQIKIRVHPVKYEIPATVKINGSLMDMIYIVLTPRLALFNRVHPRFQPLAERRLDERS